MSRPYRSGPLSFFTLALMVWSPLSSRSRYISLSSTLPASSALVHTSVSPFVHVLSDHCARDIIGGALSKFARDCAPFEAHLIDQVLMKMIPWATSVAQCVFFYYRRESTTANATSTIYVDVSFAKRLHTVYLLLMPHKTQSGYLADVCNTS